MPIMTLSLRTLPVRFILAMVLVCFGTVSASALEDLYEVAQAQVAEGQYAAAAATYARLDAELRPNQAPWRVAALAGRAWALIMAGERDSAVRVIVRLNALDFDSPLLVTQLPALVEEEYLLRKAAVLAAVGLPARETLERYRDRFPRGRGIAGVYRDLAREAVGMDEWRSFLRQAVAFGGRDPRMARWRLELAEGELSLGDTRAAIRQWKTVVVRYTSADEALEAVERLCLVTGRLPIGDPVFVLDLESLVSQRQSDLAARGSLVATQALLARTRAMMAGEDPDATATVVAVPAPSNNALVHANNAPPPVSNAPMPAVVALQTSAATSSGSPSPAADLSAQALGAAPVVVRRILIAPLPARGGVEDYLKPLVYRVRRVAESRGQKILPDRSYYRYAAGAHDITDAVLALDIARRDSELVVTISVIYPAADVTDVFTLPWKDRPLDTDYDEAAAQILRLIVRD